MTDKHLSTQFDAELSGISTRVLEMGGIVESQVARSVYALTNFSADVASEVLLLDEPCSALDPISTGKIEELIHELKSDYTVAIVTHNMQQAARCADQVAFFYLGEMVECAPAVQIFTAPKQKRTQEYVTGRFG